ncbi:MULTISPECIES: VOC family protein [unclassified Agromyces]|uniref:VOC family protein n=1 Tax=unclassified Agromyces TaxID=2639701 RepID=UPI003014C45B
MAELAPIQPCLWFDSQAREAMEYYVDVFPDSRIVEIVEYPDESLDPHFAGMSGKVVSGRFTLNGVDFTCLDGGPLFTFNESISFIVSCADQAEIDHYWSRLSHVPDAEQCGWCKDRFGVSWQVVPANLGELTRRPEQVRVMMRQKRIVIDELVDA